MVWNNYTLWTGTFGGFPIVSIIDLQKFQGKRLGYLDIAEAVIEAISSGRLPANSNLPTSRYLAKSLGVSRDTVVRAFEHLKSLGWIESHGKIGMFVSSNAKASTTITQLRTLDSGRLSRYAAKLLDGSTDDSAALSGGYEPIRFGVVPKSYRPMSRWKKSMQTYSGAATIDERGYIANVLGRPELREEVSSYICSNRGAPCTPEEVIVFNGSFNALSLIFRLFLEPGDSIAVEDPGFPGPVSTAEFLGLNVIPVPIDAEGISVDAIERTAPSTKLVYVTPNHQEPTGVTMSLARRKQLLSWAQRNGALIIEDEHDGIFHYGKNMPPPLKSMDTQDNVIYLTSFWQILYPLTAMCLTVVPQSMCEILNTGKIHTANLTDHQPQLALADLLGAGYLQRHISKLEREFAARRRALTYELKRAFGARAEIPLQTGGLKFMVYFKNCDDAQIVRSAQQADLPLALTAAFYQKSERKVGECIISFPELDETTIRKKIETFKQHLGS